MTTDIVSRSVVVAALDEVADLRAEYAYSESALQVRLTQAMLELIGCAPLRPETDFALELHAQTLGSDGDTDGIPLASFGTATVTFTGTADTPIPAGTTVKKAAVATLWETIEATAIPHGGTTVNATVRCTEAGVVAVAQHTLNTISPAVVGLSAVDNAADATPGAEYPLTLRMFDRRTGGVVCTRRSTQEITSGVYAITRDADQASMADDGNAGLLVLRWDSDEADPPPVGSWLWTITLSRPEGDVELCRGEIEVLS
jgi:hypothetical protein